MHRIGSCLVYRRIARKVCGLMGLLGLARTMKRRTLGLGFSSSASGREVGCGVDRPYGMRGLARATQAGLGGGGGKGEEKCADRETSAGREHITLALCHMWHIGQAKHGELIHVVWHVGQILWVQNA